MSVKRLVAVRLPAEMARDVDHAANQMHSNASAVIRLSIQRLVQDIECGAFRLRGSTGVRGSAASAVRIPKRAKATERGAA
jgi:Arc/MetJ-type ribon-helix-helix transcriptional regulator